MSTADTTEPVEHDAFEAAREQFEMMEGHLRSPTALRTTHAELEEYLGREGRELQRLLAQAHFELLGAGGAAGRGAWRR